MARILISGITGQDGSYLAERLAADGHQLTGLVRPDDPALGELIASGVEFEAIECDLANPASVVAAVRRAAPQRVFHLAGVSSVAQSWAEPVATGLITGVGAVALMTAAVEQEPDCRVVLASSGEIFAGVPRDSYDESSAISPVNPYGAAKAYAHLSASVLRGAGKFVSVAVLFNHESPRRPPSFVTRKITMAAARVAAGLQSTIELGNLDARRDWGWAPDYVDAMIRICEHSEPADFVVATGEAHSVRDFADAALRAAGVEDRDGRVVSDPQFMRAADAPTLIGDPGRAKAELGWAPTVSFDEMVAQMVRHDLALLERGL